MWITKEEHCCHKWRYRFAYFNLVFKPHQGLTACILSVTNHTKFTIWLIQNRSEMNFVKKCFFAHSFTGCVTTSSFDGVGKGAELNRFVKNEDKVKKIGEKAGLITYDSKEQTMNLAWCKKFSSKEVKAKSFVKPETLPTRSSTLQLHSYRTYYQVMKRLLVNITLWQLSGAFVNINITAIDRKSENNWSTSCTRDIKKNYSR